jgi:hypothetical protein
MYSHWKWSTGEQYPRSGRMEKQNIKFRDEINAINQSLSDEPFLYSRNQNPSIKRRDEMDIKLADREMIAQRGINPFFQTSYVNDVVTRDMFLKPINTTSEKIIEEKNNN